MPTPQEPIPRDRSHDLEFADADSVEKGHFTTQATQDMRELTTEGHRAWRHLTDGDLVQ
jgi:hypothetical protein